MIVALCGCMWLAVGCADIRQSSKDSSMERIDDNSAIVRCHNSGETLHLTCVGTRWLGARYNCSGSSSSSYSINAHMAAIRPAGV